MLNLSRFSYWYPVTVPVFCLPVGFFLYFAFISTVTGTGTGTANTKNNHFTFLAKTHPFNTSSKGGKKNSGRHLEWRTGYHYTKTTEKRVG